MISKKSLMNILIILLFLVVLYYVGWTINTDVIYTSVINYPLSIAFALLAIRSVNKRVYLIIFAMLSLLFMILGITNVGFLY